MKLMSGRYAPYGWSVLLHVVLLSLLGVSLYGPTPHPQPVVAVQEGEPIRARAVDAKEVETEVERLRSAAREEAQREALRREQVREEERRAREMRQQEERRVAELKQRADEERKAREAAEQKRLADLKQAQELAEKKRIAEEKRAAELEKTRKQEEARKKEETRKKEEAYKQEEARKKAAAEQELKAKLAEEQRRMAAENERREEERARQQASARQQYINDIRNKVERVWRRPPSARLGMTCTVLVQQLPTGDVVGVRILRSSGDAVFDRSVEVAVQKASPLPPPPIAEIWEREIEFNFEAQ